MAAGSPVQRISVDGKFFRLGAKKFYVKGLTYGPFAPNAAGQCFASPEQTAADFAQIRSLGANVIRVYHVPGRWFLDLAAEHGLYVLIDIPWNKQLCFLDAPQHRQKAREAVRHAVYACARHPAVFAFCLANEIPPDVVRWSGAEAIADFLDELVMEAKRIDPECLCTFANYPPTEFLNSREIDFLSFNVYLHGEQPFKNYLARLQMMADAKPLILTEFGVDSIREGETAKCEMLAWHIEAAFRGGLAGTVLFSFTDDWFKDGLQVEGWGMGLTTRERVPRPSCKVVQEQFRIAPHFPLSRHPKVSVVVASYNGDRTLKACLESLLQLNYPDFEVILVDDGSQDTTPQIAFLHPKVRYFRHEKNLGLSVARNTGIAAATGEIVAFTDSDCRTDPDWLYYLVNDFLSSDFAGLGGPNLLPPEDSAVAAAVMVSPGGPAHVMLTDRQAEHIPGCNMAFYKWALEEIGGFDPIFRLAGDDVDVCWRIQQAGHKIGFSPGAFVWHYRRSTLKAYLKQQQGYGEAEALLVRKHPEYFNSFGGGVWRGRIYGTAQLSLSFRRPIIYRGFFGSAGYQALYAAASSPPVMLATTLEYYVAIAVPVLIAAIVVPQLLALAVVSLCFPLALCGAAGARVQLPRNRTLWWSRPLVALLYFLQPVVRGLARYQGRLTLRPAALGPQQSLESVALRRSAADLDEVSYWAEKRIDRLALVAEILHRLERERWPNKADSGWNEFDVEIYGSRWSNLQLTTVSEDHAGNKQMIRCRLRPTWSLQARVMFWSLAGAELAGLGLFARGTVWPWLGLLSLVAVIWLLHRQERNLQSVIVVFLDKLARDWKLVKVCGDQGKT